jgi:two-component system, response regulator YesN
MLKAIIADDEKWICQMIGEMIDWEELGIELIAQAEDGLKAYQLICSQKPDIVITDIRMPGMDGIELIKKAREMNLLTRFIIISGFQHFEYAKNAIKFGVDDYLLKPIKKVELTNILEKIREDYQEIESKRIEDAQIKKKYHENNIKLRRQFLGDLVLEKIDSEYDLNKINAEYQFSFYEGCFQIIDLKLDRKIQGVHEMENDYREVCYRKYLDILINTLQDYCYDIQRFDDNMYLLNFSIGNQQVIDKKIKETFNEFRNYLISLNYFDVTLGLGSIVPKLGRISKSADAAKRGIKCRIKYGVNQIIDYSKITFRKFNEDALSRKEEIKLRNIIETLDVDNLLQFINNKFSNESIPDDVDPCIYFYIAHQIADLFIDIMSSINTIGNVKR